MKHCLVFASLISPSKMILFEKKYQTFDTVFHHQMKHLEVRQQYSAARRIFNSLLGVSSGDETLHLMFDILHASFITPRLFLCFTLSLTFLVLNPCIETSYQTKSGTTNVSERTLRFSPGNSVIHSPVTTLKASYVTALT